MSVPRPVYVRDAVRTPPRRETTLEALGRLGQGLSMVLERV